MKHKNHQKKTHFFQSCWDAELSKNYGEQIFGLVVFAVYFMCEFFFGLD